jgi:hypothetical protein
MVKHVTVQSIFALLQGGNVMKKISALFVSISLVMLSLQGCYGKMALTKKVYALNGEISDKFVRSLVTWAFIFVPVYGVSAFVDFVLFNTIEFWSGKNPVAQREKDFKYSANGETFQVHAKKSGDTVNYLISHYQGERYLDTMSINWDVKSGSSMATYYKSGEITEFTASRAKAGVIVTKRDQGSPSNLQEVLAQY